MSGGAHNAARVSAYALHRPRSWGGAGSLIGANAGNAFNVSTLAVPGRYSVQEDS